MRHPPIACRRATQSASSPSLQHIWIPDDLLERALDRFFRSACTHQRRYGSHVPGPLEARRRAAKRRMTAQAHVSPPGAIPHSFSFGALFGFRSSPQPSWRYEPPSIPKPPEQWRQSFQAQNAIPCLTHKPILEETEATSHSASLDFLSPDTALQSSQKGAPCAAATVQKAAAITTTSKVKSAKSSSDIDMTEHQSWTRGEKVILSVGNAEAPADMRSTQLRSSATMSNDLQACLKKFQLKINTATTLPDSRRFSFLVRSIQSCCPTGKDAGDFTLLAFQHLRRTQLSPNTIITCLTTSNVALPCLGTPKGLEFVRQLNDMAKTSPKIIRKMDRMYRNIAATVSGVYKGRLSVQDTGLRMLYRAIWENALRCRSHDQNLEASTISTLHDLGSRFSDPRMQVYLNNMLNDRAHTVRQIDHLVGSCSGRHQSSTVGAPVLDCIPRTLLGTCITSFPQYLLDEVKDRNDTQKYKQIETWLKMVHTLDSRVTTASENMNLSALAYQSLAAYGLHPSAIGRYLKYLQPRHLVNALLDWLPQQKAVRELPAKQVEDFVRMYRFALEKDVMSKVSRNEMLARLLARMQQQAIPHQDMANLIIELLCRYKDPRTVFNFLRQLKKKGVGLSEPERLQEYLLELDPMREALQVPTGLHGQDNASTLHAANTTCEWDENLTLLRPWGQFKFIIDSARAAHVLPIAYRTMPLKSLMSSRAELIHQIAYQYSLDRTRNSQENWRSTYFLYRYLDDNQLPIGPLFTRAVMRMAIIQPLSENRFVSARRLTWVCQKVAPVESVQVAKRIEHIFWLWRGDLILHAKRTLHRIGGSGRAHVNTMKRLGLV